LNLAQLQPMSAPEMNCGFNSCGLCSPRHVLPIFIRRIATRTGATRAVNNTPYAVVPHQ
jgi:hypothetical protein